MTIGRAAEASNTNAHSKTTFRPKKAEAGTKLGQLRQYAEATLGTGSLRQVVLLPEGEDLDEWLAVNSSFSVSFPIANGSRRLLQPDQDALEHSCRVLYKGTLSDHDGRPAIRVSLARLKRLPSPDCSTSCTIR